MYPIDPNRPLSLIVSDLASRTEYKTALDLGRSVVRAILEKEPLSLLSPASANCLWRNPRLDERVLAQIDEVVMKCATRQLQ